MKFSPTLEEVKKIAQTGPYKVLPVSCEILSDICTPMEALKVLKNVEDIGENYFTEKDVVRHKLVQDIVNAYEEYNGSRRERRTRNG